MEKPLYALTAEDLEALKVKLKEDIKAELQAEGTGENYSLPLAPASRKYARADGPLRKEFGDYRYAKVWEAIRRLSIMVVGKRTVYDFKTKAEAEFACDFAEYLCQITIQNHQLYVKNIQGGNEHERND